MMTPRKVYLKQLKDAASRGFYDTVVAIIKHTGNVFSHRDYSSCLSFAAWGGNINIVLLFLEMNNGNITQRDYNIAFSSVYDSSQVSSVDRQEILILLFLDAIYNNKTISNYNLELVFQSKSEEEVLKRISICCARRWIIRKYGDRISFPEVMMKKKGYGYELTPMERLKRQMLFEQYIVKNKFRKLNFEEPFINNLIIDYTG